MNSVSVQSSDRELWVFVICLSVQSSDRELWVFVICLSVQSSDRELWVFVSLNLALVYLRTNRHDEFMAVLNTVEPESLSNTSYVVDRTLSLSSAFCC